MPVLSLPLDLQLTGTTDPDILVAVAANQPFPDRPNGTIQLGSIGLTPTSGKPLSFDAGGTTVTAQISAGVTASAGVFDRPSDALAALKLGDTPGLDLSVPPAADDRYALVATAYRAAAVVNGTHPIGAVGSLSVGVNAAAAGALAVLHRFGKTDGARTVLDDTLGSFGLPRHVETADALRPGTWVIAEADGSVALNVAASLGYNVDYIRRLKTGQLAGDVGLKIDAALTAAFALEVSGRYVLIVGRESADERVRVRLFKLSRQGLSFGLDLKVGVTGVETVTPGRVDDLIKTVFGVHGVQIATALQRLDQWTDPSKPVGTLVAGLANDKALQLLQQLTGVNPATEFNRARQIVLTEIRRWQNLGSTVSAELAKILGESGVDVQELKNVLTALAQTGAAQAQAFKAAIDVNGFASSPIGRLLAAAADHGVLSLLDRLPDVRALASNVLDVLNGTVVTRLQTYVDTELDLDQVFKVVNETDFNRLDSWFVGKLSAFLDKELHFTDLDAIRSAIQTVRQREQQIYARVQKALNSRYGAEFAATWQRTTANTAAFDVEFDTTDASGRALLAQLLQLSDFGSILASTTPAVRIRAGVLTHEVTRKTTVNLTLPHVDLQTETVNQALASVTVEASGPGLFAYQAGGTDVVTQKNRYRSTLAVGVAATIDPKAAPDLRVHAAGGTWSYELLHAGAAMRRTEMEQTTRPFIQRYMNDQFTGATSLADWYRQLDDSVEARLHNGPDTFGDACIAEEVTLPAAALAAWFRPSSDVPQSANAVSLAIQRSLRDVLLFSFLTDVSRLHNIDEASALLTWVSMPPSTGSGAQPLWDHRDAAALNAELAAAPANLRARLPDLRLRLEEAGMHGDVQFYQDDQAGRRVADATAGGRPALDAVLVFESDVVLKAIDAFKALQAFLVAGAAANALDRLASFAGDITAAFNSLAAQAVFARPSFSAVAQSVFLEAARALDPAAAAAPRALFTLSVLDRQRTFDIGSFIQGRIPPAKEVTLGQRLVSL